MFSRSQHFVVAGGTFYNVTNYNTVQSVPSGMHLLASGKYIQDMPSLRSGRSADILERKKTIAETSSQCLPENLSTYVFNNPSQSWNIYGGYMPYKRIFK
jgi:hypothetical protein